MAIRFDIDKYNVVREQYLKFLCDEKQIDIKYTQLFEIYKTYWANDPEVKAAEKEHKAKKSIQISSPSIATKETNKTNKTNKKRKLSSEQRIIAKIEKIHSQWGNNAQSTRNDAHGNFIIMRQRSKTYEKETDKKKCILLTEGFTIHIDGIGNCTNLNKVRSFISNTRSNSVLDNMKARLRSMLSADLINSQLYNDIFNALHSQELVLKNAQRNSRIITSRQNHLFDVEPRQLTTMRMFRLAAERQDKPIKHYSVHTCRGGLPSLGKRR